MRTSRALLLLLVLLVAIAAISWYFSTNRKSAVGEHVTVYYTAIDGRTEVPWTISMRPQQPGESAAEHLSNAALYAATQAVAGPASNVQAVRFPPGTHVLSVNVTGSQANVDLSGQVADPASGEFGGSGEMKSLVWTLTALPGIDAVGIRVRGETLKTLPGNEFEIDQPLHRSDW